VKRLTLAAGMMLAVAVPGVASASSLSHAEAVSYGRAYVHAAHVFGMGAVGCKLIGPQSTCSGPATADRIRTSTGVLRRMFAPKPVYHAPAVATSTTTTTGSSVGYSGGGGYGDVPGVPSGFASCVAMRESTNGAGSSNIYGIQGSGGQGSIAEQKQAFAQMYADRGSQPWSPYDGC
jgi:hypothetical protein